MQKITPFLWFDGKAEEAMNFYVSVFKNSKVLKVIAGPGGMVAGVRFQLEGVEFAAINGGPNFKFTEAISLYVDCRTQEEVDEYWGKLSAGGEKGRCGWLKDKYGISWQIIPSILMEVLDFKDPVKSGRAMQAMLKMGKLDIKGLKQAYDQQ